MLKNKDNVYQIFIYVFFYIFHLGMVMFKTMINTKRLYIDSTDIVFAIKHSLSKWSYFAYSIYSLFRNWNIP